MVGSNGNTHFQEQSPGLPNAIPPGAPTGASSSGEAAEDGECPICQYIEAGACKDTHKVRMRVPLAVELLLP
jgi:hypothetical protein